MVGGVVATGAISDATDSFDKKLVYSPSTQVRSYPPFPAAYLSVASLEDVYEVQIFFFTGKRHFVGGFCFNTRSPWTVSNWPRQS